MAELIDAVVRNLEHLENEVCFTHTHTHTHTFTHTHINTHITHTHTYTHTHTHTHTHTFRRHGSYNSVNAMPIWEALVSLPNTGMSFQRHLLNVLWNGAKRIRGVISSSKSGRDSEYHLLKHTYQC